MGKRRGKLHNGDSAPSAWLVKFARFVGSRSVPAGASEGELLDAVFDLLSARGDVPLAEWFVFNVAEREAPGVQTSTLAKVAKTLAADPLVMRSIRRCRGKQLARDGCVRTLAYRRARQALR